MISDSVQEYGARGVLEKPSKPYPLMSTRGSAVVRGTDVGPNMWGCAWSWPEGSLAEISLFPTLSWKTHTDPIKFHMFLRTNS